MKITFQLRFRTRMGQSLFVIGNHELLGGGRTDNAFPLRYHNEESWQGTVHLPKDAPAIFYNYVLREAGGPTIQDWGNDRVINPISVKGEEILIVDSWNPAGAIENAFYTEPFKNVLLKANHTEVHIAAPLNATHTFKVKAPLLAHGETLCILGQGPTLGNWATTAPLLLSRTAGEDFLSVQLDLGREAFPIGYKYGVYDVVSGVFTRFEEGENRQLQDTVASGRHTVVNDGFVRLPADTWKGAGVAIPVFSLRSKNSFGAGEFTDLKPLVDWCRRTGLKLIQILPINDTSATHTWTDSYPYAAISAFALHPLYLNLNRLIAGKRKILPKMLEAERKRLNALDTVDYEAVMRAKFKFVRDIFPKRRAETFANGRYQDFFRQNRRWLVPYAAFCALRDKFGTADFGQWPAHRIYRTEEIAALVENDPDIRDEIELNYFIQFHLHLQLQDATFYAHEHGVVVKGDIAIGVYRRGADVWQQPELFHADMQAGAPPDAFAAKGQNWGFPTYNWPRMKQDGFAWWQQRFAQMSRYFDAFRIDHILGFFRIWSSPAHAVEGNLGIFVPAIPVKLAEFNQRDIAFDRDRLLKPFITEEVLRQFFGDAAARVKREFLVADRAGNHSLQREFATQRQVENHFATLAANEANRKLKEGLFDLISNVILFAAGDDYEFHFRFAMEDTRSFQALDPQTREKLKELYVDYFFRRQDHFWKQEGLQKLPALKRVTNMLVCGEDLGLVPPCVPEVMKELGLLSLEIQRMPKAMGLDFSRPADAPYLSVVTPGTHDMSTLRGWWEEDPALTKKFYQQELNPAGEPPAHCDPDINGAIVLQHLASPAMWSIFQLQDLLGMDAALQRKDFAAERINVPSNPKNYWRYRMHFTLETLLQAEAFNSELNRRILQSKR